MKDHAEVLEANREFYRAFRERDLDAMERIWGAEHIVACVHPGWEPLTGRSAVLQSWQAILGSTRSPPVRSAEETVLLAEPAAAVVLCEEHIDDVKLIATNVFARESGGWRIIHHQAAPLSRARPAVPGRSDLN